VFLGLLLGALAEPPIVPSDPKSKTDSKRKKQDAIVPGFVMPDTSEERLQAVLTDIFGNDIEGFRDYVEAEKLWTKVVELLDGNNNAGWDLIEAMVFARERCSKSNGGGVGDGSKSAFRTARDLLSSPFFDLS